MGTLKTRSTLTGLCSARETQEGPELRELTRTAQQGSQSRARTHVCRSGASFATCESSFPPSAVDPLRLCDSEPCKATHGCFLCGKPFNPLHWLLASRKYPPCFPCFRICGSYAHAKAKRSAPSRQSTRAVRSPLHFLMLSKRPARVSQWEASGRNPGLAHNRRAESNARGRSSGSCVI